MRSAILLLLADQPCNGYQLMQEIDRRSDGTWRPSSGSIYPTLQQLEDEGLVATEASGSAQSGRTYQLTDAGKKYVTEHRDELGEPWASEQGSAGHRIEVMGMMGEIGPALGQIMRFGTPKQIEEARKVVTDARRALYRILAEDEADDD